MTTVRKLFREAKNKWNEYSEVQVMVRSATSNDPWGPESSLMAKIARESESPANYHMMFTTLWKRVTDYQHLKHVLKALILVEYLLRHGHDRFISDVKLRSDVIRRLKHYKYFKDGRDIGTEVRNKAVTIMTLLEDKELLKKERDVARRTEGKIVGYSYEYSNFYGKEEAAPGVERDRSYERRRGEFDDPFGSIQDNPDYYEGHGSPNGSPRAPRYEEEHANHEDADKKSDEEEEQRVVASKPKKKTKKAKKGTKGKKIVRRATESDDEEGVVEERDEEVVVVRSSKKTVQKDYFKGSSEDEEEDVAAAHAPQRHEEQDDFLRDMANSRPIFERDLITAGVNPAAEASAFGWVNSAPQQRSQPFESQGNALFDMQVVPFNAPAKKPEAQQKASVAAADDDLFDFGMPAAKSGAMSNAQQQQPVMQSDLERDPWDLAKEISTLDNLTMTSDEKKIRESRVARKQREKEGPKLKSLAQKAKEESVSNDPFTNMVQGAPQAGPTGGYQGHGPSSMAIVPVGYFDPAQQQAMVPANYYGGYPQPYAQYPQPYGYGMPQYGGQQAYW